MSTDAHQFDDATDEATVLDVREHDGPPFALIVGRLSELSAGERLILVNSFEPEPLYDVLDDRGFEYTTAQVSPDEWRVTISRS